MHYQSTHKFSWTSPNQATRSTYYWLQSLISCPVSAVHHLFRPAPQTLGMDCFKMNAAGQGWDIPYETSIFSRFEWRVFLVIHYLATMHYQLAFSIFPAQTHPLWRVCQVWQRQSMLHASAFTKSVHLIFVGKKQNLPASRTALDCIGHTQKILRLLI